MRDALEVLDAIAAEQANFGNPAPQAAMRVIRAALAARSERPFGSVSDDVHTFLAARSEPGALTRATAKGTAIDVDEWDRPLYVRSEPGAEGLDVRWQKSLLRYYADTMPGYAAAAGLNRDEYAAVMVDVKRARDEYAALAETEPKPEGGTR